MIKFFKRKGFDEFYYVKKGVNTVLVEGHEYERCHVYSPLNNFSGDFIVSDEMNSEMIEVDISEVGIEDVPTEKLLHILYSREDCPIFKDGEYDDLVECYDYVIGKKCVDEEGEVYIQTFEGFTSKEETVEAYTKYENFNLYKVYRRAFIEADLSKYLE